MKFGKTYKLTIQVDEDGVPNNTVTVEYPLTLNFNIVRAMFSSANTGKFTIYNLKEATRRKIFHDRYDVQTLREITLQAGYQDQKPLPVVFKGTIIYAYSSRQKADWVTEIEAFDGGYGIMNSQASKTFPSGMNMNDVFKSLFSSLQNVTPGAIGNFQNSSDRGLTMVGNSWELVADLAKRNGDGIAFIDNQKAHALLPNEYIGDLAGVIPLLNAQAGLLKTQRRFKGRVDVDVIFEPRLSLGQKVSLQSEEPLNDGDYRVDGINHSGTISGSKDAPTLTMLNLWQGTAGLQEVSSI
jgi:hypothetical protein